MSISCASASLPGTGTDDPVFKAIEIRSPTNLFCFIENTQKQITKKLYQVLLMRCYFCVLYKKTALTVAAIGVTPLRLLVDSDIILNLIEALVSSATVQIQQGFVSCDGFTPPILLRPVTCPPPSAASFSDGFGASFAVRYR